VTTPRVLNRRPAGVLRLFEVVDAWTRRAHHALTTLAARPATLFAIVWALSAVRFPYGGVIHDARLYALQAHNRLTHGTFSADLFLRFGSQDQYTPFSMLVAPLVGLAGTDWAFFLLFLTSNALLIFGMQRLVRALVDDSVVATTALVMTVLLPLWYGGMGIFRVAEPFFTPRLVSCPLALFALERSLRNQHATAISLAIAATVAHPLMGFPAATIVAICAALHFAPRSVMVLALISGAMVVVAAAAVHPIGIAVFGSMDAEWHDIVWRASTYNFPSAWPLGDWLAVAASIALPLAAAAVMRRDFPTRARLLIVAAVSAASGVVLMSAAGTQSYRLLLQAQPYRGLWITQVLAIPSAFWLATALWRRGSAGAVAAVFTIAYFGLIHLLRAEVAIAAASAAFFAMVFASRRDPHGIVRGLITGFCAAFALSSVARVWVFLARGPDLLTLVDPWSYAAMIAAALNPMVWFALAMAALTLIPPSLLSRGTAAICATAVALVIHSASVVLPQFVVFRNARVPRDDQAFVRAYFAQRPHTSSVLPSVYDNVWEDAQFVWFKLNATNYFHLVQLSGVLFNRGTAIEGVRRADIVRPFETQFRNAIGPYLSFWGDMMHRNMFGPTSAPPAVTDLLRLCGQDEPVDVAILRDNFGPLVSRTNGRVFVYECADVRAATRRRALAGSTQ
jgi:hypothetical protein